MTDVFIIIIFLYVLAELMRLKNNYKSYREKTNLELEQSVTTIKSLSSKPLGNYENDIKFLLETIEFQVKVVQIYRLKPMSIAGYSVIKDELFEELRENLCITIYNTLSENYKKNLYIYFSEEGLSEYIVEQVNLSLLECILSLKMKFESE